MTDESLKGPTPQFLSLARSLVWAVKFAMGEVSFLEAVIWELLNLVVWDTELKLSIEVR